MTTRARELRNTSTPAERKLWHYLRGGQPRFTRQLPIGMYIADFACRDAKLVVELDGRSHDATADYDARRDDYLRAQGWHVIRFSNQQVFESPEGIAGYLFARPSRRATAPTPDPSLKREGSSKGKRVPLPLQGGVRGGFLSTP